MQPQARVLKRLEILEAEIARLKKRTTVGGGGVPTGPHSATHGEAGTDPIDVTTLSGFPNGSPATLFLREDGTFAAPSFVASLIEPHGITVDGGGAVVTTGVKGRFRIPFDYEIVRWSLLADQSGDVEFDVKVATFGGSPASIVASAPPTLSGAVEDEDATLTDWTTTGSAGDEFQYEITGAPATITRVTLVLDFERI